MAIKVEYSAKSGRMVKDDGTNINIADLLDSSLSEELYGLSTDAKPLNKKTGTTYYELDTKIGWVFVADKINPITSNGWWEV